MPSDTQEVESPLPNLMKTDTPGSTHYSPSKEVGEARKDPMATTMFPSIDTSLHHRTNRVRFLLIYPSCSRRYFEERGSILIDEGYI